MLPQSCQPMSLSAVKGNTVRLARLWQKGTQFSFRIPHLQWQVKGSRSDEGLHGASRTGWNCTGVQHRRVASSSISTCEGRDRRAPR